MDIVNFGLTVGSVVIAGFLVFGLAVSSGWLAPQPAFAVSSIQAPGANTSNYANAVRLNARF
jgi:hypothetical protein